MTKNLPLKKKLSVALITKKNFENNFALFIQNNTKINTIIFTKIILKNSTLNNIFKNFIIHFPTKIYFDQNFLNIKFLFLNNFKQIILLKIYNKYIKANSIHNLILQSFKLKEFYSL